MRISVGWVHQMNFCYSSFSANMSRITESFLKLLETDGSKTLQHEADSKVELVEVIQLRLPLTPWRIL